jgi:polyisoprenoid-binding protein YceI
VTRFRIDPDRSRVWVDARSSLHPVHAETAGLEGWFEAELLGGGRLNPTVAPKGELALEVAQLSSGNPLYDREMRRRVDVRKFPTISGTLTSMKETDHRGRYLLEGDVTFRGVTRSYEDEMTLSVPDDSTVQLEGDHTFDIRDFGMEPPRILSLRVYPEVAVRVAVVATKEEGGA